MKNIRIILLFLAMTAVWSCNEEKWLAEKPLSFYAPENSYSTIPQLKLSLNFLYDQLRATHWNINGDQFTSMHLGDIAYGGTDFSPPQKFNNFGTWFVPTAGIASSVWDNGYRAILNANTIINRLEASGGSKEDKAQIEGEALFFRAFWYNFLANLYGGVPVYTEEITTPRTNFTRASRSEVYEQSRTDLERAVTLLSNIDAVDDGRVNRQAAQHLLTEVYISLGNYTKAIEAASAVISYPAMKLMTSRFGSRAGEPGNPYWDLFQNNNQNRKNSGNKESILVLQFDYKNSGSVTGYNFPRQGLPFYLDVRVARADGGADVVAFPNLAVSMGGRGIGVIHPTDHFLYEVWGEDGTKDYRNSSAMIVRDVKIENPLAAGYGQWLVADGHLRDQYKLRHFYPMVMKFSRTDELPDDVYAKNSDGSYRLSGLGEKILIYTNMDNPSANSSMKDEYLFRLGGTYLLRAEAYIKNNQLNLALADINTLRDRANATPAQLSQINIDYLMDEQMRERYFEDYRMTTLFRMGKFVERTRKYSPVGSTVADHNNLFPIPYSEIERNKDAVIEQNPGYN